MVVRLYVEYIRFGVCFCLGVLGAGFAYALPVQGDDIPRPPVPVFAFHQPGRIETGGTTGYSALLYEMQRTFPDQMSHQIVPLRRAIREFRTAPGGCFFAASFQLSLLYTKEKPVWAVIFSDPIDIVRSYIFSRNPSPVIHVVEDIVDKTLSVMGGMPMSYSLPEDTLVTVSLIRTPDENSNLRMLRSGRVEYIYGWVPDTLIYADRLGVQGLRYDPDFPITEQTVHLACKKTQATEEFMAAFNRHLRDLKEQGALRQWFSKYATIADIETESFANLPLVGISRSNKDKD